MIIIPFLDFQNMIFVEQNGEKPAVYRLMEATGDYNEEPLKVLHLLFRRTP